MILLEIDIPKISKEGPDIKGSFSNVKELHSSSIINSLIMTEMLIFWNIKSLVIVMLLLPNI